MKGNQGLEALAALCGGQAEAVASTPSSTGTVATTSAVAGGVSEGATGGPTNTDGVGAGDANKAGAATATSSAPTAVVPAPNNAVQESTSSGTKGGTSTSSPETATNQLPMCQATEQLAAATSGVGTETGAAASTTTATNNNNNMPVAATAPTTTVTPQQWSQALAVAANLRAGAAAGGIDPAMAQSLLFSAGLNPAAHQQQAQSAPGLASINNNTNNNAVLANTMQQFAMQQYIQAAKAQQQQQAQAQAAAAAAAAAHPLFAMALAAGKAGHLLPNASVPTTTTTTTGPPDANSSSSGNNNAPVAATNSTITSAPINTPTTSTVPVQQHQYQVPINPVASNVASAGGGGTVSTGVIQQPASLMNLAAVGGRILPSSAIPSNKDGAVQDTETSTPAGRMGAGDKKQQKRAANRRSAQLSRKRKKQFIEELKEENEDLKRKEQILRAIPDLIVVFDSSGKLGFVSESVGRFLDLSPDKLEGTSFWDLICEDSVRLLKAAFMDSLAAREADSDTSMLGDGVWELRLKNNDSKYMLVTLNGVVHFKGDAPECVCCIRPLSEHQHKKQKPSKQQQQQQTSGVTVDSNNNNNNNVRDDDVNNKDKNTNRAVSCSDGDASRISDESNGTQQSVLSPRDMSLAVQDQAAVDAKSRSKIFCRGGVMAGEDNNSNNGEADGTNNSVRISDGDSIDGLESDEA